MGVHENAPVLGSIDAPAGAPASRLKVKLFAGRSGSLAVAVKVSAVPSSTVLSPMAARTGDALTSFTVTVIVSESLNAGEPLSVTRTVIVNEPGPCASVGVHVKTPVLGLIDAPDGAPGRD